MALPFSSQRPSKCHHGNTNFEALCNDLYVNVYSWPIFVTNLHYVLESMKEEEEVSNQWVSVFHMLSLWNLNNVFQKGVNCFHQVQLPQKLETALIDLIASEQKTRGSVTDVSKRITAKKLTVSHSMSLYLDQDQGGSSGVVFGLHKTEAVGKHIIGTRNTCFFFVFFSNTKRTMENMSWGSAECLCLCAFTTQA